jgi:hypothetical protein
LWLADQPGFPTKLRGQLILLLRLSLCSLEVELVFPKHVCTNVRKTSSSHACKYHGNQMWRHPTLKRLSKHGLLDAALLNSQIFLSGSLLLLSPLLLLGLCGQPVLHTVLGALPLGRSWWKGAHGL